MAAGHARAEQAQAGVAAAVERGRAGRRPLRRVHAGASRGSGCACACACAAAGAGRCAAEAAGGGAGSVRAAAERRRRRGERGGTRPGRDGVDRRRGGAQVQRHERLVDGVRHVEEMVDELVRAVEEDPARLQQRLPGMAGRFDEEREQVAEDVRQRQRRRQRRDEERPAARRSEAADGQNPSVKALHAAEVPTR